VIDSIRSYWAAHHTDRGDEPVEDPFAWWEGEFIPETWPPFVELLVDPEGNIWLRPMHWGTRYLDPIPAQVWPVFDSTGAFLGSVPIPGHVQVTTITRDAVLGTYFDEWDSLHLVRYALEKGEGG
jgi:hypothetical protein